MNVLIMCSNGYGRTYSAINAKSEYIALGLKEAGCDVRIIDAIRGIPGVTVCEENTSAAGVPYVVFPQLNNHNIIPNLSLYKRILTHYRQHGEINHIIIGMEYMPIFIYLTKCAKKAGYTTSTLFHEWHIGMQTKGVRSLHKYWQDYRFGKYVDAIYPISHLLQQKCARFGKPTMLLPVLGKYDRLPKVEVEQQFTYCADAGYLLRNQIILRAFSIVAQTYQNARLILVLFGRKEDMHEVQNRVIELHVENNVAILSQISQSELEHLYASSLGLLIPLNPDSMQDIARFSQKIAEYLASGRPIITSNVGEIPYYFVHNKNAKIAAYTSESYAEQMLELINDRVLATEIGQKGYETGNCSFEYSKNGYKLKHFIQENFG